MKKQQEDKKEEEQKKIKDEEEEEKEDQEKEEEEKEEEEEEEQKINDEETVINIITPRTDTALNTQDNLASVQDGENITSISISSIQQNKLIEVTQISDFTPREAAVVKSFQDVFKEVQ